MLPLQVIRVRCPSDFTVPDDGRLACLIQMHRLLRAVSVPHFTAENPVPLSHCFEVLPLDPGSTPPTMFLAGPTINHPMDVPVHLVERGFAGCVSVVIGPPPDETVKLNDERSGFSLRMAFQSLPHFLQEGFHSAVCRSDEQFLAVLAQVLAQKVKTFVDGGNMRLGDRERHSPLGQIFLHDGLDPFPQSLSEKLP